MARADFARNERPVVFVDGRRLTAQSTGVGRYLSLLLDRWAGIAESLPFEPVVILREDRPRNLDPWKSVFRHEVIGTGSPGWIWENLHLARAGHRNLTLFAPANLAPWRWRGPVVLVAHDTFCEHADAQIPWMSKLRFRGRYRRSARRADLVLTPSRSTAEDVRSFFGLDPSRIRVIRPGLSIVPAASSGQDPAVSRLGLEQPFVLFVGKTSARRDFPAVIEAVERISRQGTGLKLVRVGPGTPDTCAAGHLIELGHVPDAVLAGLYRSALALVWPSTREGFGLPVLEAMAHGCPVITRPVNALSELCLGSCLELADTRAETIAAAIEQLMADRELRSCLIRSGLERAKAFGDRDFADEVAGAIASVAVHSSSHQRGGAIARAFDLGRLAVRIQH